MTSEIVRRPLVSRTKKAHLAFLELTDFKSYAGTHKLGPLKKGMNCIVGPNGSGKSNLMEAICWVLGVETRHLRGIKMADLAYRKEGETCSVQRRPEVQLTIHVEDDEGRTLEIKSFKRRVAENRFQFLIDEKAVDKEAYYKALAAYGVLPKVQNCIVSQGQVESLSLKSEKEKGILFDEVSGSALLKPRYEQLKLKLRECDLELRKIQEKIKRKDTERKSYEAQAKELEDYETVENSAKQMECQLYLFKLYVNSSLSDEVNSRSDEVEAQIANLLQGVDSERKRLETAIASKRGVENQLQQQKDRKQFQLANLQQSERDIELYGKRIQIVNGTISDLKSRREEKQAEIDSLYSKYKGTVSNWLASIENYEEQMKTIEQKRASNAYAQLDPAQKMEFEKKARQCQLQTSRLRSQVLELMAISKRLKEDLHQRTQSRDHSLETRASHEKELKRDMQLLEELQLKIRVYDNTLQNVERQRHDCEVSQAKVKARQQELLVVHQQAASRLESFSSARREDARMTRFKEIVDRMKGRFSGVFGRLSDLCDLTNQTYAIAVSVAMGLQADSIVCDTFRTAQMAIQFLKEARHPPVEFLPLDRLRVREDQSRLNQYANLFTPVINCLSFDPIYRKAFAQVLEDVVVVDNLEMARTMAYRKLRELKLSLKIVTMDGQKILKNCNIQISGGGDRRQVSRFEEKQKDETMRTVTETEAQLDTVNKELRSLEETLRQLNHEKDRILYEKQECESQTQSLQRALDNRRSILRDWRPLTEVDHELQQVSAQIEAHQTHIQHLEQQIATIESEGFSSNPMMIEWNISKKELEELERRIVKLSEDQQNTVDKCEHEINDMLRCLSLPITGINDLNVKMKMLEDELQSPSCMKDIEEDLGAQNKKLEEYSLRLSTLRAKLNEEKTAIKRLEERDGSSEAYLAEAEAKISSCRKSIREYELKIYELGMEKVTLAESLSEIDTQATDILNEIVSKSVTIPTKNGTFEDLTRTWSATAATDMDDGNGVDIDFSQLPDEWKQCVSTEKAKSREIEIVAEIKERKAHLSSIHPNFKAREHLEDAKETLSRLKKTHKELSAERQKIDDEFSKCRECRCEKFKRCFEKTKMALESIYSELTRGTEDYSATEMDPSVAEIWKKHFSNVPGGVARLELIEEPKIEVFESGVSFYAMPPGKRFTEMDALSGGEKSMATLALLFALQSHRPSPFVVLDEVDAALDVTNVESLRNWLKKAPFQVIIVTLKDEMFCHADAIIGVYKDHERESSGTLSLDVEAYA